MISFSISFRRMHLLQFLEICVGELPLWPTYILELLFQKEVSPENIINVAAFFFGHGVPLEIASRLYSICNINSNQLVPNTIRHGLHIKILFNRPCIIMSKMRESYG